MSNNFRKTAVLKNNLNCKLKLGEGGTAIYGLYGRVCAAVKGMVFKQFTLG